MARLEITPAGSGGGSNHNILSATHSDSSAGTVVRGDLVIGNSTPAWARVALGAIRTALRSDGTDAAWGTIPLVLDKVTADTTVSNGTETNIYSFSVAANTLSTNNCLRLTLLGKYSTDATEANVAIRLKYGVTTLATITTSGDELGNSKTNNPLIITAYLCGDGATNSQRGHIIFNADSILANTAEMEAFGTSAIDSTSAATMAVSWDWVDTAGDSYTMEYAVLELLA